MKMKTKNQGWYTLLWGLLALVSFCFVSCKDDDKLEGEKPYDPDKPVVISSFTPEGGGLGSQLVLYGDNFGNDASRVRVTIGGQNARIINVKNQSLLCFVPSRAYDGDVEITILDEKGEELTYAEAEKKFDYKKKTLVTTFLGTTYDNNTKYDQIDGPFDNCGGFNTMAWMVFDPNDHNKLYICGGSSGKHRIVDFLNREVKTITFPGEAAGDTNIFSFSSKGELIVVRNRSKDKQKGLFFFDGEDYANLTNSFDARGCRAAAVHPNGEIYTTRYDKGWVGRYDPEVGVYTEDEMKALPLPYSAVNAYLTIHPSGKYMYIVLANKHIVMRSNYDENAKTFTTPYLVCGKYEAAGWADGVGTSVRLDDPQQGCFVENPNYVNQSDHFDFYFSDRDNHCIRVLTQDGKVDTYAGRPNGNGDGGFNDGDLRKEARFNQPVGLVYDEDRKCFFVGDNINHRIRKIGLEE